MKTTSKTKSYYERFLSKIDARSLRKDNQQKFIDFLKPRSNKNELVCKNVVAISFMCPIIKVFICKYFPFCNV